MKKVKLSLLSLLFLTSALAAVIVPKERDDLFYWSEADHAMLPTGPIPVNCQVVGLGCIWYIDGVPEQLYEHRSTGWVSLKNF